MRNIHIFYEGTIPDLCDNNVRFIGKHYNLKLWNESDIPYSNIFDSRIKFWDFCKYYIIHKEGGIILDPDVILDTPDIFNLINDDLVFSRNAQGVIDNYFMYASKGNDFVRKLINMLILTKGKGLTRSVFMRLQNDVFVNTNCKFLQDMIAVYKPEYTILGDTDKMRHLSLKGWF